MSSMAKERMNTHLGTSVFTVKKNSFQSNYIMTNFFPPLRKFSLKKTQLKDHKKVLLFCRSWNRTKAFKMVYQMHGCKSQIATITTVIKAMMHQSREEQFWSIIHKLKHSNIYVTICQKKRRQYRTIEVFRRQADHSLICKEGRLRGFFTSHAPTYRSISPYRQITSSISSLVSLEVHLFTI